MKKAFLIFITLTITSFVYPQQESLKELVNDNVTVNSRTKWRGKSRKALRLDIPENARGFFYTLQVSKADSPLPAIRRLLLDAVAERQELSANISNRADIIIEKEQEKYIDINVFLLPSQEDSKLFEQRLNYDYKYLYKWEDVGDEIRYVPFKGPKTLYLGFHNTNPTIGLNIQVQVVAK